jgi:TonB family protein
VEGCEDWRKKPSLSSEGWVFFVGEVMNLRSRSLSIFFPISLGVHLLLFSLVSFLFQDAKVDLPVLHLEVSLVSTMAKEGFSSPVTPPANPDRKEEKKILSFSSARVDPKDRSVRNPPEVVEEKKKIDPFDGGKGQETPLRVNPEQAQAFRPGSRRVDAKQEEARDREGEKPEQERILQRVSVSLNSETTVGHESQDLSLGNPPPSGGFQSVVNVSSPSEGEIVFIQPRYGENPKPPYPPEARRKGYYGEVLLKVEVLSNGQVGEIEVKKSSGHDVLDRSALSTVRKWKFIPARKGETPVSLWVNIPIRFQLQ